MEINIDFRYSDMRKVINTKQNDLSKLAQKVTEWGDGTYGVYP